MNQRAGLLLDVNLPMPEGYRGVRDGRASGQSAKLGLQWAGLPWRGEPVTLLRRARMQSVVLPTVDANHLHIVADSSNRGLKTLPIETIGIQLLGGLIGGGDQYYTLLKHHLQQAAENDRITDVVDE